MSEMTIADVNRSIGGKLAVLFGGRSAEREISLKSGAEVAAAFNRLGVPVETIDVADDDWMRRVKSSFSQVFIALHGPGGEDGTVQGALECLGVKYTGSGVLASALAMDKYRCKQLWLGMGLSTPKFVELTAESDWSAIIADFGGVIVKPTCEGSSIGMSRAATAEELKSAWQEAQAYGRVFAEQWVVGSEYTVAILNGKAMPAIKLETDAEFYDFNAKYLSNETRYLCPCGLSTEDEQELSELALAAFNSLACEGWGRVDVMRDSAGRFNLLEVNTVPGMTDHSLVPMAAKQAGLNFDQLVLAILAGSLADGAQV
ncbi:D-alanine--D-alanine ligase B [Zhongshania aliphaticivorans]|uniref:D-alanine--D-alanine ligase n=1 Tax=Zhongshania aliphaticivorans TaxID=1470434 RepID=A0A5S9N2R7_9GAMM|nr:D-alanine--D-alanine ligase B [Zhongshania aliphaticivorans]CAA0083661.1 D-alanine--D-alanine ligase B [Zhongshania aliphaticivorans]